VSEQGSERSDASPVRGRVWPRRLGLGLVAALLVYLLVGFLVVPRVVEWQLVSAVEAQLGLTPTLERVRFDPLRLRLGIEGFVLAEPGDPMPLLTFESLLIDLDGPIGFLRADLSLDEIEWVGPRIAVVQEESGELVWLRLWAAAQDRAEVESEDAGDVGERETEAEEAEGQASEGTASDDESSGEALIVDLGRLRIVDGSLAYRDRARPSPFELTLGPIDLELEALSTRAGVQSPGSLAIRLGEAGELRWEGMVAADPMHSKGRIELDALELGLPWRYLHAPLRFDLRGGRLGFEADYELAAADGMALAIRGGSLEVEALELVEMGDGAPLLTLPSLRVDGIEVGVEGERPPRLGIDSILGEGGRIALRLESDGRLQLVDAFAPRTPDLPAAGLEDDPDSETVAGDAEAVSEDDTGPEIEIGRLALENFALDFEDRSASSPVSLELTALSLEIEDYGTEPGRSMPLRVRSGVGESGELSIEGPIALDPLEGQIELVVKTLDLAPFRPYLAPVARFERVEGSLSSVLTLGFAPSPSPSPEPGRTADVTEVGEGRGRPEWSVQGSLSIDGLRTSDPLRGADFLGWRGLRLEGLSLGPEGLALEQVALDGLKTEIVQQADGRSNLAAIFGAEAAESASTASAATGSERTAAGHAGSAESTETAAADFPIRIDLVSIDDGALRFVDRSGEGEAFSVALEAISGRIESLSSEPGTPARVELEAELDGTAPLRVSGTVDPLSPKLSGQLDLTARGISLPSLSPLAGRFVGLGIARGKLDLDLDYGIEDDRLDARNRLVVDGLRFGEKVAGSSRLSLPLPLAVAVLRDASGKIRLDIPVQGDLGDPSFRVLGVLGRTLVQIITKAATSPFALLPIPGGGDASQLVFAPGVEQLAEKEQQTLRAVADVLAGKPELIVEILGRSNPARDARAMKSARLEQALRSRAHAELSEREQRRVGDPASFALSAAQRRRALEQLYLERIGPALPPDPASRSDEALEAALIDSLTLEEGALEALARARARQVQAALQADPRLEPERVRLREIEVLERPDADAGPLTTELSLSVR